MKREVKKGVQNRTPKKRGKAAWERAFLTTLASTANVSEAARTARIGRQTAYDLRDSAPDFAQEWDDALEQACDLLELEARRRAEKGVRKVIFYKGEPIGEEWEYSDTLMIFLLKAHRPQKFRETIRNEHSGPDGGPIRHAKAEDFTDDELAARIQSGK